MTLRVENRPADWNSLADWEKLYCYNSDGQRVECPRTDAEWWEMINRPLTDVSKSYGPRGQAMWRAQSERVGRIVAEVKAKRAQAVTKH